EEQAVARSEQLSASRRWPRSVAEGLAIAACSALAVLLLGFRSPGRQEAKPAAPANSIAVLPFSNFTSHAQMDYLGDGLSDELIHALTRVPALRVVGRTSSFQFKGKSVDVRKIGAQLQARLVLEGSVQRDGDRLRITAQLIDANTGLHIWSEK